MVGQIWDSVWLMGISLPLKKRKKNFYQALVWLELFFLINSQVNQFFMLF